MVLAVGLLAIHTIKSNRDAERRAKAMRLRYVEEQRDLITFEVNRVVRVVDYEINKSLQDAKTIVKDRVSEAY